MPENLFRKHPRGPWIVRLVIKGRERRRSTGLTNLEDAKLKKAKIEDELRGIAAGVRQEAAAIDSMTFKAGRELYYESCSVRKKHPERDKQMFAHAGPAFDGREISNITSIDC